MTDSATNNYVAALGLIEDPFREDAGEHFFYADPGLMQRLDLMQHLTQFGDQLLLITGAAGSGKSTLQQQFRTRAKPGWQLCQLTPEQATTPAHLLHELADHFGTAYGEDAATIAQRLMQHAQALQQEAGLAIVIIDDAQRLSDEALTTLLTLGGSPKATLGHLRILMFSEPGLAERLINLGLHNPRTPSVHTLDIPPFDARQSAAYLMYRLAIAGYSGDSPFSSTEVEAMHKSAGGLPGALNALARDTLSEHVDRHTATRKQAAGNTLKTGAGRNRLLAILLLAGAGLGGWLFWQNQQNNDDGLEQVTLAPLPLPPMATDIPPADEPVVEAGTITREDAEPASESQAETPAAAMEPAPESPAPPVQEVLTPAPVEPESMAQAMPEPESLTDSAQVAAEPAAADSAAPPDSRTGTESDATAAPGQTISEAPPADAPSPEPATPAIPAASPELPDWVASAPDDHYSLQLVGVSSRESAENYIEINRVPAPTATLEVRLRNKNWYIAIQGNYPDKDAALSARDQLPEAIRRAKPWPRTFQAIREDHARAEKP